MSETLGWHWMARLGGLAPVAPHQARSLLSNIVEQLELHAVSPVSAVVTQSGVAAVVLLAESHLALHTVEAEQTAFVDLFSCVPIDAERASELVASALHPAKMHSQLIARG